MPHIIPIRDLKDTMKVSELCHSYQEPIYVTKNGYGDMVLMSMEVFEAMNRRAEIYRELAISEKQFEAGEARDAFDALSDTRSRYGL